MRKHLGSWLIFLFSLFFGFTHETAAVVILDDTFESTTQVDGAKTTSQVNTANGEIHLPLSPLPDALSLNQYFGAGYAVAQENSVNFYSFDSAVNQVAEVAAMKIDITNPLGISLQRDAATAFILTEDKVTRFDSTGSEFIENPAGSISGLNNVISIASGSTDSLFTLSSSGSNTGVIEMYSFDGSSMQKQLTLETGISNPISIATIPNSLDLVITSSNGIYYYPYTGSGYPGSLQMLTGVNGFVSVEADEQGNLVAARVENGVSSIETYLRTGTDVEVAKAQVFSDTPIDQPVAVSLDPDVFTRGYITQDGRVEYQVWDGTTMKDVPEMSMSGLSLTKWYLSPRVYQSVALNSPISPDLIRITVEEANEAGGSQLYEVSGDGGSTWIAIVPGNWTAFSGNQIVVRATQSTSNRRNTPKLQRIVVEVTQLSITSLEATKIYSPGDSQTSGLPTSSFPVFVKAGGQVEFQVSTTGQAEEVTANFSDGTTLNLIPQSPLTEDENNWIGWYSSAPDDSASSIGLTITVKRGSVEKTLTVNPFVSIENSVHADIKFRLIE